ncbi:MAG: CPBP family intramembrane metalloprotease [Firmicutes bacterium]|nr:CPBP family intramembrane metalloprotease [Bacillota bacterium]
MNLKTKKNILLVLSILNTIICCFYCINNSINSFNISNLIVDLFFIFLAFIPCFLIAFYKRFNHLYYLTIFYGLFAFLGISISTYILSMTSILVSFIESKEEKGKLIKVIKRHPLVMSITIVLSCVSCLAIGSVFEFFSTLTYGFSMLGELIATIFLFFLILICKKGYLIYKNKGSIKDGIIVSLPFILYSIYIGCGLFSMYLVEGYSLVSIENIITVILLYILVGIFEDFLTRGITLNILLDKYGKTKRGIWFSIFLSSLIFGAIHFTNIFTGASFEGVLIQVISATCIGMYFSAIYLRSGSVWVVALLHGFYDVVVSIPSFFDVKEIVDVSSEYGDTISNYSWSNLIIGLIFILLTLFLLRKKKFDEVYYRVNDKEYVKPKENLASYVLIGVGSGMILSFAVSSANVMFQLKDYSKDLYDKLPISWDYQYQYGLIYNNGYLDYDNMNDTSKMMIAFSNIDKIVEVEEKEIDKDIITYISKEDIIDSFKDIFNKAKNINYLDFNYSNKTSCSYENNNFRYKCITKSNSSDNYSDNVRVYSNIEKVILTGDSTVELSVYYLVEDLNTNTLYLDSNLKTVYKYDSNIKDLTGVVYNENDEFNKEFWDSIKEKNNGFIPTYKISLELNDFGNSLYFVSSELDKESIENNYSIEKDKSSLNKYISDNYSFVYDNDFKVISINNYLVLKYKEETVLKIDIISSDDWLDKYKESNNITLGNNIYHNILNDYYIYKDEFYVISIYTEDVVLKNKLLELVSSISFK